MNTIAPSIQQQWTEIAPILTIQNEQDYDASVTRLNELIDEVGTDESHPLYTLLDTLGVIIHAYEQEHYPSHITSADKQKYSLRLNIAHRLKIGATKRKLAKGAGFAGC